MNNHLQRIKISNKQFHLTQNKIEQTTQQNQHLYLSQQQKMQHYTLNQDTYKQSCPATLHNSTQASFQQPIRKLSMADLNPKINIDKVMIDIKLTPLKSNDFSDKIRTIYNCLNWIKNMSPSLLEEVRTAQLIVESIESKFAKQYGETTRNSGQNSRNQSMKKLTEQSYHQKSSSKFLSQQKEEQILLSLKKTNSNILNCNNGISPIKQLDEATSRIVYSKFSIKDLENSCKKESSHQKNTFSLDIHTSINKKSLDNTVSNKKINMTNQSQSNKTIGMQSGSKLQSGIKNASQSGFKNMSVHKRQDSNNFTVSNFDDEDQEMDRLTKNIQALDKVLQQKGLSIQNDFNSKNQGKASLKQANFNAYKQSMLRSDKKPLVFNSKQKSGVNKENW